MKALKIIIGILIVVVTLGVTFKALNEQLICIQYDDDELPIEDF